MSPLTFVPGASYVVKIENEELEPQMFVICFDMDISLESNYEPRFLAVGTG